MNISEYAKYVIHQLMESKHIMEIIFTHSGGHGGQNVNKRKTKAELLLKISPIPEHLLTQEQKDKLILAAQNFYHEKKDEIFLYNQETRYQERNKENVLHHLQELMEKALEEEKERIPTDIPSYSYEERFLDKKKHSLKKQQRQEKDFIEE